MSASPAFQETHAKPFWPPLAAGIALGLVLLLTFVLTGHGLGATGASTRLAAWLGLEVAPAATESNAYLGPMVEGGARSVMASWISWQVVGVAIGAFVAALLGGRFRIQFDGSHSVGTPRRAFAALLGGLLAGFGARVAAGCTSGLGLSGAAVLGIAAFVFLGAFFAVGLISYRVFRGV
ncbi:YeeE/YedE thiosulfate transporter family protein [Ottowia sp.]|uniref:YeeE/YedE thiosulfate transporter family protein n=1 Tax=Ottowia sp. TaxID=1898956 RepID=UPI001D5F91F6|nr:YeeE/YedE thiosulfate transporter family protein [Ottowia sp.]MCP5257406.1 YeeE/YedE family protein [Burkholderiaceae bacterium]MCB2025295.1 YeeE/YedE family protein [Ottowia sp.]MCB2033776.1 YeeE/YedE family protein [Ottowia sp.]MCB2037194.1 YeeE/YedE family protein [Ottowia sp.]HPK32267.1 YeeE/YedE thiosulfate transporter family protein [Ottowia sp.]